MKKFLLWVWQLPQNIAGLILTRRAKYQDGIYFRKLCYSAISLGNYIVFDNRIKLHLNDVLHEDGHRQQSKILGPLYLIVIGLPSLVGNILSRIFHWSEKTYYSQPWEKWADKLGKVDRF